jgi:hypothetical protein
VRLSREAKAYAAGVRVVEHSWDHAYVRSILEEAFQAGMNHAENRQRALARLSKPKGETT